MSDGRESELRDADLRAAFAPLAGDAEAMRARVLAALPQQAARRPTPAPRPRAWPWVAAGAAAGLLVGWLIGRMPGAAGPVEPDAPVQVAAAETARVVGKAGELFVEGDDGVTALAVGDRVALDRFVGTNDEGRAFLVLPGELEIRLNKSTRVALVGSRSLELAGGQLCLKVPPESRPVHLATLDGAVTAAPGMVQVTAKPGRTEVVTLEGKARFEDHGGDEHAVVAGQVLAIVDGVASEPRPMVLAWDHVAWQVDLLAGGPERREEAYAWAWTLIEALGDPERSARAEHALRTAGGLGAAALGMAANELPDARAELRRHCWLLLAQIADGRSVRYLLGGPMSDDPEIRFATVHAIERITGIPSGGSFEFWRDAPYAVRFDTLRKWRERVLERF